MAALYDFDGTAYRPGPLTVGPWSPDAQHGGPVAALLAGAIEQTVDPRSAMDGQILRVTVELMRPVPLSPLTVRSEVIRAGRSVQWVDAFLFSGDQEVARARGLRVRKAEVEVPVDRTPPPSGPPPVDARVTAPTVIRTAFVDAVDLHFVSGSWDDPGPVTMWTRLKVAVVEGQAPSPLQRTVAAADFGNGVSRVVDFATHTFINPDLTVALARPPEGEWILFDVVSRLADGGFGQSESQIWDGLGPVGRSVQSLLVNSR